MYRRLSTAFLIITCILFVISCKRSGTTITAFYYWKTGFQLTSPQQTLLKQVGVNTIYVRFFDVQWDASRKQAYPNAVVSFNHSYEGFKIEPVIYIANKTFENIPDSLVDSLAIHCNTLINKITAGHPINYQNIQVDCDWTLNTRAKYFKFLSLFQKLNRHQLQATIRLHQVKYKGLTGVPPVNSGVLMFYNMGQLNANLHQPNSIYNNADAEKYIRYLDAYRLRLDIALPMFSWGIHIREGKVIQVYGKVNRALLSSNYFEPLAGGNNYKAKQSFFMEGIYIKQNDIFKLEEINAESLKTAAKQLVKYLPEQQKRTIIYYELANINPDEFNAETIKQVSDCF